MADSPKHSQLPDLDPEDWPETRALAHRMLDDMLDLQAEASTGPAWQPVPEAVKAGLRSMSTPQAGVSLDIIYEDFKQSIAPWSTGNRHPRFFGWAIGNGTVPGMLADLLASGLNPHLAGFNQSPPHVEERVVDWLIEAMGFPAESTGLLVGGGSMANLNALAVARQMTAAWDVRRKGLQAGKPLRVYGSSETHSWIHKACALMGLGEQAFRPVPVKPDFTIDLDACSAMIRADIEAGAQPFCLIGNSATVNTGAIDDMEACRALADASGLWFHVDGALGSMAALAPSDGHRVAAHALADSLAFDLHKWGYLPYEVACVIIRHPKGHEETFAQTPSYLVSADRGVSVGTTRFADRGLELSRGFKALKVWMSLRHHGFDGLGAVIQKNIDQTRLLASRVTATADLELMAPVGLNVVCFRYNPGIRDDDALNALNAELLVRLQESGIAVPSQTVLNGRFALRVCNVNHRTRNSDIEILVDAVLEIGRNLSTSCAPEEVCSA